jgi:hypothetical protein
MKTWEQLVNPSQEQGYLHSRVICIFLSIFEILTSSKAPWMGGGPKTLKDLSSKWKF